MASVKMMIQKTREKIDSKYVVYTEDTYQENNVIHERLNALLPEIKKIKKDKIKNTQEILNEFEARHGLNG
jgi:hypothetical protein